MAYAAVISLKHTLERLTNPIINQQITNSAHEELKSLEQVLTRLDDSSNSGINRSAVNALDADMVEAASKLEYAIESHMLHYSQSLTDEEELVLKMESFLEAVKKLKEEYIREVNNPQLFEEVDDGNGGGEEEDVQKSTMVGLADQCEKIRDELEDWQSRLKVVSLFGMAGIGKTLVARKIYEHNELFGVKVWVRIGPKRQLKSALVDIISRICSKPRHMYIGKDERALADLIYESLCDRKFLIVLDDIWSTRVWDYIKKLFPTEYMGSAVLVTTRLEEVARYAASSSFHQVRFLNEDESWSLFWQNVFAPKLSFPPQLERVGRKIAKNCEGLPLLILAVAEILSGEVKTEEYWNEVAHGKTKTFVDAYGMISKVLLSSYDYLPQHLKACFLYLGVFPQKSEIRLLKLINLWSLEDFLGPNEFQTVDDYAMECVNRLISNSLVILCKRSSDNRISSCKLHSVYWYLCVEEARKNKFFHVLNKKIDCSAETIERQQRLCVQNNVLFGIKEVYDSMAAILTARFLLCTGEGHQYPVPVCLNLMLLKVLDTLSIRFYEFPEKVVKLLQLRYLALTLNGVLTSSISNLHNLQILIIRQYHSIKFILSPKAIRLPKEIWDIQELRHLWIMGSSLPDPSSGARLPNLSTLYTNDHSCTKDVFRGIPKLKKLRIKIELEPESAETLSCFEHIGLLNDLGMLKCVVVNPRLGSRVVAPPSHLSNLPRGLKKLSLNGLGYSWKHMGAIGSLPYLEVLKVRCYAFLGPEWETKVGEFQRLEFLLLEDVDLEHWTTDEYDCFPSLQRLIIQHCYKLKKLPSQIGSIQTLKTIEVVDCNTLVMDSAKEIQEGIEENYWNFCLEVSTSSSIDRGKVPEPSEGNDIEDGDERLFPYEV